LFSITAQLGLTWKYRAVARSSALGLRRDPHGSVKQIDDEELEDGNKERPGAFPQIMLKQTDSDIQQLYAARERAQDQQRRRRSFVDCRHVSKASGIMRAAPYIANSNDASVGIEPAGTTTSGRKIAAMVKPLATRTLIAVTSEASRIAFIVVIGSRPDPLGRFPVVCRVASDDMSDSRERKMIAHYLDPIGRDAVQNGLA
jgi:hypothetical protein